VQNKSFFGDFFQGSMKKDLKAWRQRVDSKNKAAEKERQKREKILAEVSRLLCME
jgi:hypothetical protein